MQQKKRNVPQHMSSAKEKAKDKAKGSHKTPQPQAQPQAQHAACWRKLSPITLDADDHDSYTYAKIHSLPNGYEFIIVPNSKSLLKKEQDRTCAITKFNVMTDAWSSVGHILLNGEYGPPGIEDSVLSNNKLFLIPNDILIRRMCTCMIWTLRHCEKRARADRR